MCKCFFWYRPTRVVPDKKPLNGCVCVCVCVSKVIERIVGDRLLRYLHQHDLLPHRQSAYRRHHSTENALLHVLSDIYAAADRQEVTLLGLLDPSAAFDCVDHQILLRRLRQSFGIGGAALTWIEPFLRGHSQQVAYAGSVSAAILLLCGVPQGSVLGPLLAVPAVYGGIVRHHCGHRTY